MGLPTNMVLAKVLVSPQPLTVKVMVAVEPGPLAVPFGVIVALVPVPERGVMGAFDGDIAQVADAPAAMGRLVNV